MAWLPHMDAKQGPIYLAIADALAADVAAGRLAPGDRLPTQRDLARRLGIDLTTVTRAYAEAAERGLVASEGRRGSFVRGSLSGADERNEATTGMNMPPEAEGGLLRRRILETTSLLLTGRQPPLHYDPTGGSERQRAAAAAFIGSAIPQTPPDQVVVAAGAQSALFAVLATTMEPGDKVAAGCFTYPGFLAAARRLRLEVVPIAMDEDGLQPVALTEAAAAHDLRGVYLVPTNDNPTTATMPLSRRQELANAADKLGLIVIEDDAYGRLSSKPIRPLASFAPEITWYIATASKLISPSLRVAFLRAPNVRGAHAMTAALHDMSIMAPPLNVAIVTQWLEDGTFLRLLADVRGEASVRMSQAAEVLAPLGAQYQAEGYHIWLPLPSDIDASALAAHAIAAGLPAVSGTAFAVTRWGAEQNALRISLGGSASRARMLLEVRRLDAIIAQASPTRAAMV